MKGIAVRVLGLVKTHPLDVRGDQMFVLSCGHEKRIHTTHYVQPKDDDFPRRAFCNECKPCKHQFNCSC